MKAALRGSFLWKHQLCPPGATSTTCWGLWWQGERAGCCPLVVGSRHCTEGACLCRYHPRRCSLQPASAPLALGSQPENPVDLRCGPYYPSGWTYSSNLLQLPDWVLCKGDWCSQQPAEPVLWSLLLPPGEWTGAKERRPSWYMTATRRDRDPHVPGQDRSGPLDRAATVLARPHYIKNYQDVSYEAIGRHLRCMLLSDRSQSEKAAHCVTPTL